MENLDFDPYEVLGVTKNDSASEINRAFVKKAKLHHPDNYDSPDEKQKAEQMYERLSQAKTILTDDKLRRAYDNRGQPGAEINFEDLQKHFGGSDMFRNLFGAMAGGGGGGHRMAFSFGGADGDFGDIFGGAAGGSNFSNSSQSSRRRSSNAGGGAAAKPVVKNKRATQYKDVEVSLEQLFNGVTLNEKVGPNYFQVPIKPGLKPGSRITFNSSAHHPDLDAAKELPGDLVFVVKSAKHPVFTLDNDRNLHMNFSVTLKDALEQRPRSFTITAIDQSTHQVKFDAYEIIKDSHQVVIPGKGLPATKAGHKSGDLVVTFRIILPSGLSDEQRRQIVDIL